MAVAFVLAQTSQVAEAWALLGAVVGQLSFGRCVALEISAYLPLVWGFATLTWMRRREYV